MPVAYEGTGL